MSSLQTNDSHLKCRVLVITESLSHFSDALGFHTIFSLLEVYVALQVKIMGAKDNR